MNETGTWYNQNVYFFTNSTERITYRQRAYIYSPMRNQPVSASLPGNSGARTEAANYVAELTGDLAALARQHGLTTLDYILDMARFEAENESRLGRGDGR